MLVLGLSAAVVVAWYPRGTWATNVLDEEVTGTETGPEPDADPAAE